jgi:hypothetical protein
MCVTKAGFLTVKMCKYFYADGEVCFYPYETSVQTLHCSGEKSEFRKTFGLSGIAFRTAVQLKCKGCNCAACSDAFRRLWR